MNGPLITLISRSPFYRMRFQFEQRGHIMIPSGMNPEEYQFWEVEFVAPPVVLARRLKSLHPWTLFCILPYPHGTSYDPGSDDLSFSR